MSKELRRLLIAMVAMSMSLGLCAARPPERGHEISGAMGGGRHVISPSCHPWRYDTSEAIVQAEYHYRSQAGWSFSSELGMAIAKVKEVQGNSFSTQNATPEHEPGDTRFSGQLGLRVGYHGEFWGGEIGPAFYSGPLDFPSPIFLTAEVWIGDPDVLYGFMEMLSAPLTEGEVSMAFGIGHASPRFRFETGYDLSGFRADLSVPVYENLWVGAGFVASDVENWDGFARASYYFGE